VTTIIDSEVTEGKQVRKEFEVVLKASKLNSDVVAALTKIGKRYI
jgi:hypothetical protein